MRSRPVGLYKNDPSIKKKQTDFIANTNLSQIRLNPQNIKSLHWLFHITVEERLELSLILRSI